MASKPDPMTVEIKDGTVTVTATTTEGRLSSTGKSFNMLKTGMKGVPVKISGGEYDGVIATFSGNVYVSHTNIEEAKL